MNCPLKESEYIESQDHHTESYWTSIECDVDECAWWDNYGRCCSIKTLAQMLTKIQEGKGLT